MAAHSKMSPSNAERWINCPGSVSLSDQVPPSGDTTYTLEGTIAHELSEMKIRDLMFHNSDARKKAERIRKESEFYNAEMEEATDFYVETVIEHFRAAGPEAHLMIEQRFGLTKWVPDAFGTADAVILSDDSIEVIDLKYGKGVKVDAGGNPQFRLYALGAADLFQDLYDYSKVKATVIQPRLGHVDSEEMSLSELLNWGREVVVPAAALAVSPEGETMQHCGDWCRWCPAKAVCRKRAEYQLELAKYDFRPAGMLDNTEIADILNRSDSFKSWLKAVEEYALGRALKGEKTPGYKLVEGRSNRKFADEQKVVAALTKAGYEEALLYERKLYGITAMEKLVGKKKLTEILGDLIIKPTGAPVLVPDSDPREEFNANNAKEDFKEDN